MSIKTVDWRLTRRKYKLLGSLLLIVIQQQGWGAEKPLWEAGIGVGLVYSPYYRGGERTTNEILPFPLFIYRGKILEVSREGIKGYILRSERINIHISGNGAIGVDSSDTVARQNMPDLDMSFELGPSLNYILRRDAATGVEVGISFNVRAAFNTDFRSMDHQGWVSNPHIYYSDKQFYAKTKFGVSMGPVFADDRFHGYYYDVDPLFVTAQRPLYKSDSGYSGARLTITLRRDFRRFWLGGFLRFDYLNGAVFEGSPLVLRKDSVMAGLAFAYTIKKSKTVVNNDL